MNNRKLWVIAIAILLLGTGLALARSLNQAHGTKPSGKPGAQEGSPLAQLNLSTEQRQKLDQVKADFLTKTASLRADLEVKRAELDTLWRANSLDENQILAKAREAAKLQSQLSDFRLQQRIATFEILTPDQRKQMLDHFFSQGHKGGQNQSQCHKGGHNHGGRPSGATKE
jgi:Spy/CpxP family protein refolding chaperone